MGSNHPAEATGGQPVAIGTKMWVPGHSQQGCLDDDSPCQTGSNSLPSYLLNIPEICQCPPVSAIIKGSLIHWNNYLFTTYSVLSSEPAVRPQQGANQVIFLEIFRETHWSLCIYSSSPGTKLAFNAYNSLYPVLLNPPETPQAIRGDP